jgi:molecular chaperone Hsp33
MNDQLTKGHFKGLNIAFSCTETTHTANEVVIRHDCDPLAAHILGRSLTGALLSAAILPEHNRINICWKYKGMLKTIIADAGADGTVRAFISPAQIGETEDVNALYGDLGDLQAVVSRAGKILNSGTAPVSLQDAVKDLAFFHCVSDQVETGMSVMIGFNSDPHNPVRLCRGWMIQALPDCDLERFDRIRQRMETPAFRDRLSRAGGPEELAAVLIADEPGFEGVYLEECSTPRFSCACSKEKMSAVLRTLPIPERMEIVKKNEPLTIRCQFCNAQYELSTAECITAWNEKTAP